MWWFLVLEVLLYKRFEVNRIEKVDEVYFNEEMKFKKGKGINR